MKRWHCGGHILSAKPSVPLWIVWEGKSWMQERAYSRAEAHALSESLSGKVWLFLLQTNWLSRHFFPLWNDSGLMKADQSVGRKRGSGIRKTGMELMGFFFVCLFVWFFLVMSALSELLFFSLSGFCSFSSLPLCYFFTVQQSHAVDEAQNWLQRKQRSLRSTEKSDSLYV